MHSDLVEKTEVATLEQLEKYCMHLKNKMSAKTILLFDGPLGSGKTKTIECLLHLIGVQGVGSPTFALHHSYTSQNLSPTLTIDHFDLYRIGNASDLESIGFWDVFSRSKGWVLVEWSKRLERDHLPRDWHIVSIEIEFSNSNSTKNSAHSTRVFTTSVLNKV